MKTLYYILFLLLTTLSWATANGQTYPMQVEAHLLPPYSLYLSDYYSGTREKLVVTLINRDQFQPVIDVRLRATISAAGGVKLRTNENLMLPPIRVEQGLPVRLSLNDLAPYLQPSSLISQGFVSEGRLPEGMVEFCFQATEANTGRVISLPHCTRAWITSQKPPLLSIPLNNESVLFREPLNIMFQWTPRHQGVAHVEYEFILKELWDNGMAPQAAFAYSPEIYRETVRGTSFIYGPMQPPLLPGKRYAWCVRAQARDGVDAVNVFQNDGFSEVWTFTLQNNCPPPDFVTAETERKAFSLSWNQQYQHIGYTVSYRLMNTGETGTWTELQVSEPRAALYGLKGGATYEYRVGSFCMAGEPVFTPVFTITLPASDSARLAQCGLLPDISLTNKSPLTELRTGEVFMANDYPVTVTQVSGANGVYTGKGWTVIPWFNDAKLAVQFTSITINTDKQMVAGYVDALYDKNQSQVANLDDIFTGGFDVGRVNTGITSIDTIVNFTIPGIDAFALGADDQIVITDSEGNQHFIPAQDNREGQGNEGNQYVAFSKVIQDKEGNLYQVEKVIKTDEQGNQTEQLVATAVARVGQPLPPGSFDPTQLNGDKAIVTFEKGEGYFAFDTWQPWYDKVMLIRDKYQKLWENYYAPHKLLVEGQSDVVKATIDIKDQAIDPAKVVFKTPKGTEFNAEYNNGSYTIHLVPGPVGDAQEIYALYPNGDRYWTLGKVQVSTYAPQQHDVVLVSVNYVTIDEGDIKRKLQEVYGPLGITWNVTVVKDYAFSEPRLMEQSTGLSTYNEAMRALNNHFKEYYNERFNPAANYLFFLKATGSQDINNRDLTGFMPRGGQFGYIFASEVQNHVEPVTVAHELGHGRWKLIHTFDEHYGGFLKGETQNLMDYANGGYLAKWQWDLVHDPAMVVSVFEGDEQSESNLPVLFVEEFELLLSLPREAENVPEYLTYITPSGHPITLPLSASPSFTGKTNSTWANNLVPKGVLLAFKVGQNVYGAAFRKSDNNLNFLGYRLKGSDTNYYTGDNVSSSLPSSYKAIIARENEDACTIDLGIVNYSERNAVVSVKNPHAVRSSLNVASLQPEYKSWAIPVGDCSGTPPDLTYTELLVGASGVIYPYGDGALLFYQDQFIFRGLQDDATEYYLYWDGSKWVPFALTVRHFDPLIAVLAIWVELLNDHHFTLDAFGSVPVIGEAADALNGVIYFVEGDRTNAYISFAGTLPIAGEGIKYSLRSAKAFIKGGTRIFYANDFVSEMDAVYTFMRNSTSISSESFLAVYKNINTLAVKYGTEAQTALTALAKSTDDKQGFLKVLEKLNELEQTSRASLPRLFKDINGSSNLVTEFIKNEGSVDSWKVLDDAGYAALKKNPVSLEKVSDLLKNPKLLDAGLDEGKVSRLIKGNRNAGGSAAALDDLTKGLNDLVSSGTKFEDIGKLVTDLEKGGNFAEGAGWIQRYVTNNVDEFSGKTLIFESVEKVGETIRRVDVKMPDDNITRYFEFKSVSEIPPINFANQFVKDMQISDVSDLGQIKWLFDGKKVSSLENSVDDFINALDEIDIPQSVIDKLAPGSIKTKDALLDAIESRFNDIFKLK